MKTFWILVMTIFCQFTWACPNCAGSENAQDKYTVYILAVFIAMTYIPLYMLFKLAFKKKTSQMSPPEN